MWIKKKTFLIWINWRYQNVLCSTSESHIILYLFCTDFISVLIIYKFEPDGAWIHLLRPRQQRNLIRQLHSGCQRHRPEKAEWGSRAVHPGYSCQRWAPRDHFQQSPQGEPTLLLLYFKRLPIHPAQHSLIASRRFSWSFVFMSCDWLVTNTGITLPRAKNQVGLAPDCLRPDMRTGTVGATCCIL